MNAEVEGRPATDDDAWRTDPAALKAHLEWLGEQFEFALRRYVAEAGREGVDNLHDAMAFALGCDIEDPALRGKRIRPLLCLLTAEALGEPIARAMPFALAIELMHNFALVHDDIQDGDIMRRGRDAAWIRFGLPHGINIGDYLLVHAFRALTAPAAEPDADLPAGTRMALVDLIGRALDHTHIGQALEINQRGTRGFGEADYLRIVREKTGHYLAAPIQGGAIVAGAPADVLAHIGELAMQLGPLFQIIDDVIDLTDGKGREAIGSDIREGKRSFLVAHTAQHASAEECETLFATLDKPREETTTDDIAAVLGLFEKYQAIEAGRRYCDALREESNRALAELPEALSVPLGHVFEMLVSRKH